MILILKSRARAALYRFYSILPVCFHLLENYPILSKYISICIALEFKNCSNFNCFKYSKQFKLEKDSNILEDWFKLLKKQ